MERLSHVWRICAVLVKFVSPGNPMCFATSKAAATVYTVPWITILVYLYNQR